MNKKLYLIPTIDVVAISLNTAIMSGDSMPGNGDTPTGKPTESPQRRLSTMYV